MHGKAELGSSLLQEARNMAQRLGLLVAAYEEHQANKELFRNSPRTWIRAASRPVWGLYCWAGYVLLTTATIYSSIETAIGNCCRINKWNRIRRLFFDDKRITLPPVIPIPGCKEHDDIWLTNSLPEAIKVTSQTFSSVCKLWVISQEFATISCNLDTAANPEKHFEAAETKYQELLQWANTLPADMTRKAACPAHVIYLQLVPMLRF